MPLLGMPADLSQIGFDEVGIVLHTSLFEFFNEYWPWRYVAAIRIG
jgi:hypothetical protein